jgi:hypothetical protein
MSTDGSSGGLIRLITIDESGATRRTVKGDEVPLYDDEIMARGARAMALN